MDIVKSPNTQNEPTVALGSVKPGSVFRYAHMSFTDAIKEDAFYTVMKQPEKKGVSLFTPKDGLVLIRDPDHRVIVHTARLVVDE